MGGVCAAAAARLHSSINGVHVADTPAAVAAAPSSSGEDEHAAPSTMDDGEEEGELRSDHDERPTSEQPAVAPPAAAPVAPAPAPSAAPPSSSSSSLSKKANKEARRAAKRRLQLAAASKDGKDGDEPSSKTPVRACVRVCVWVHRIQRCDVVGGADWSW